ncbi:hypothetical protein Misp02_31190 [Microtetraspora sp. NBRC 16547]|nr:hypothetical protein Misp02_31190 [Microtetraspora sp. NBRC 16547]
MEQDLPDEGARPVEEQAALGRHDPARRGQGDRAAAAVEEGETDGPFQSGDLLAHRGLGDVQLLRGTPEVEAVGDGEKDFDLPESELHSVKLSQPEFFILVLECTPP